MPELPEVETVVRELEKTAGGAKILKAEIYSKKIRIPVPARLGEKLEGRKILGVTRRAKYILMALDNGFVLVIHLGMSGRIHVGKGPPLPRQKHDHLALRLTGSRSVVFNDPRRFGLIAYMEKEELESHPLFRHLGPEPFSKTFTAPYLAACLANRKTPVKIAIMDQALVVGVGNIYACEALFDSGIAPETPAGKLSFPKIESLVESIRRVLKSAIKAGGSTLRDYRKTNGDLGYFQHKFSVYDRAGKACGTCTCDVSKTGGVQKTVQGGRSTFYCPRKQV